MPLDKKPKGRLRMARDVHSKNPGAVLGREDLVGRILNYVNCEAICAVGATTKAFDRAAGHVEALSIVEAARLRRTSGAASAPSARSCSSGGRRRNTTPL